MALARTLLSSYRDRCMTKVVVKSGLHSGHLYSCAICGCSNLLSNEHNYSDAADRHLTWKHIDMLANSQVSSGQQALCASSADVYAACGYPIQLLEKKLQCKQRLGVRSDLEKRHLWHPFSSPHARRRTIVQIT